MKMKLMVSFTVLLLLFSLTICKKGSSTNEGSTDFKEYSGFLMDVTCGTSGVGLDKSDVKNSPQDHTVGCLKACEASGYGIMIKDGNLGFYKFTKFDAKGNELAIELLKKTTKKKGIEIDIKGVRGDNDIAVTSLVEKM